MVSGCWWAKSVCFGDLVVVVVCVCCGDCVIIWVFALIVLVSCACICVLSQVASFCFGDYCSGCSVLWLLDCCVWMVLLIA